MTYDSAPIQAYINDPLAVFEGDYDSFRSRCKGAFDDLIATHEAKQLSSSVMVWSPQSTYRPYGSWTIHL